MLSMKKGETAILKGFTGIKLGVVTIDSTTKKTVTALKKNGEEMIFDRKTGKQINVEEGKERYANSLMEDDGSYVAPATRGAAKRKAAKKSKAKPEPEEEDDEDDEDEEEEEEEPAPKKAKKAKKSSKKAKQVDDEDDDEDDDEFEEIDD